MSNTTEKSKRMRTEKNPLCLVIRATRLPFSGMTGTGAVGTARVKRAEIRAAEHWKKRVLSLNIQQ